MVCLIGSKLAKIIRMLERVEKTGISWHFRVKISCNVSLPNRRAPGVCFVLVFRLYLIFTEQWAGIPDFSKTSV